MVIHLIRCRLCLFFVMTGVFNLLLIISSCQTKKVNTVSDNNYSSLIDSTHYVGIETCKNCHADKYETFINTGMGKSFDIATRKKSSAFFTKHDVIYDKYRNLNYNPHWVNDSLVISEFRLSGRDTIYRRNETVSWIVGSGQHTNSHLMNENGYVYQVPATFYTQKGEWDLPPGFEGGYNSRFSRMIGLECMTCHNSYPEMVSGSENKYNYVANGINCERCHGPGSEHVKEKLAGNIVDIKNEIDYTIVNPSKLPIALQLDICQRCHIQGNAVLQDGKSFLDFRPGMKLSDVMDVYMPLYKNDDDSHIMASHAERMKMSKCFSVSLMNAEKLNNQKPSLTPFKSAMTCVTCHDPHVSVKVTSNELFNQKCKSCHASNTNSGVGVYTAKPTCTESMEKRLAVRDDCIKCHMPKNGTIDIPHVSTTDHWIRKPLNQKLVNKIKEFAGLICINNPTSGNKSKGNAFLSYFEKFSPNPAFLDSAKMYFNDDKPDSIVFNFSSLIRWAFLKNDFVQVIKYTGMNPGCLNKLNNISYSNDDAWTCYRIGESYVEQNENLNALAFFRRAVELAPYQLDFRNKLAGVLQDLNFVEDARNNYEFILHENPKYSSAYVSLGYLILIADNDIEKALSMYNRALDLDPDNIQAFINKAGIMIYKGKKADARKLIEEVLKRDKSNERARRLLSQLK